MIVVVVIGILASIAYPSYMENVNDARRAEAMSALETEASNQERFFTANSSYQTPTQFGVTQFSQTNLYLLTIAPIAGAATFILTATPQGGWVDPTCGNFSLTNVGRRLVSADANQDGLVVAGNPVTAAQVAIATADAAFCWR
jgi:type IV pilus assembly protein PilE